MMAATSTEIVCPSWCINHECDDEHFASGEYVPATGGQPFLEPHTIGAAFPCVGAVLITGRDYSSTEPLILLHTTGYNGSKEVDEEVCLRLDEAEQVAHRLLDAVRAGRGAAPLMPEMPTPV